jgi:sigma-B regulation protein RsbU (phosphoserine phosphatase)
VAHPHLGKSQGRQLKPFCFEANHQPRTPKAASNPRGFFHDSIERTLAPIEPHTLQCFEVWGGNDEVDRAVRMPGLNAWVLSRPHNGDATGGDIHYLSSCATGRIGRVLLADVSGHGAGVSSLAVSLRGLMRVFVNYVDHTKLVEKLNQEFARLADPGMFATACVLTWWAPTGEVDLSSAGHPPALLFERSTAKWSALEMPLADAEAIADVPLGIIEATTYQRAKLKLREGDMLLLYSDAMIESRSEDGSELGVQGLIDALNAIALSSIAQHDPKALLTAVLQRVSRGNALNDDATLLLMRRNDVPVAVSGIRYGITSATRIARETIKSWLRGVRAPLPEFRASNILGPFLKRFNR